jgi:hypothetical protein
MKLEESLVKNVVEELTTFGFLGKDNEGFVITELGKKVNKTNLPAYDAGLVLDLLADISQAKLLEVASNIDIARRIKRSIFPFPTTREREILRDYINEAPLDFIKVKHGSIYDDQNIIELGE